MKRPRIQIACLLLALIPAVLFWPVTGFPFINLDDPDYVKGNAVVQHGLTLQTANWAFQTFHASNWHPLTWLSHALDCELYGLNSGGHHFTSVLIHCANAVLLFLLLEQTTSAFWCSIFVAALFAWHPLHVESVAWVAERKDVLSTFFFLLTIWAYVRYTKSENELRGQLRASKAAGQKELGKPKTKHPKRSSTGPDLAAQASQWRVRRFAVRASFVWYLVALGFFALALMSKPMVVTLPFVLLLLDYWPLGRDLKAKHRNPLPSNFPASNREPGKRLLLYKLIAEKLPFLALAFLGALSTVWAQSANAIVGFSQLTLPTRLAGAAIEYLGYLEKALWPRGLTLFYPYPIPRMSSLTLAVAILFALSVVVYSLRAQRRYLLVGWFWFLGTLVPVIGLVQVGVHGAADRYMYIPLIGLSIMLSWGVPDLVQSVSTLLQLQGKGETGFSSIKVGGGYHLVSWTAPCLVLGALLISASVQLMHWRDTRTVFEHSVEVLGGSISSEANLAQGYAEEGNIEAAIVHYTKALEIKPSPLEMLRSPYLRAQMNLGAIFAKQGRWTEALVQLEQAVREEPGNWRARSNLAQCLLALERVDEAVLHCRIALRVASDSPVVWNLFGAASLKAGKSDTALKAFREAVRLNPNDPIELNQLAWFLATDAHGALRNGQEALGLAIRTCQMTKGRDPGCLAALDAAYAETGQFEKAISAAQQTLALAEAQGRSAEATAARERLELYLAGKPFRQ